MFDILSSISPLLFLLVPIVIYFFIGKDNKQYVVELLKKHEYRL
jgi:fructose-1-phosphate kinase PfkB-like protein